MSALHIYDSAPLGSLIRFSNGEPRPPSRFTRKLRAWNDENGMGRLVEKMAGRAGDYPSPATFALHLGNYGSQGTILMVVRRIYTVDSRLRFEIADQPKAGMVRILSRREGREELHHLASDMTAAETWSAAHRYHGSVMEVVTAADRVVSPAQFGRAA
ncbi:hypothetical protein GGQ88_003821 [Novosphingobium hassiacum]|uniref:Uncharacterized protein n=1 Tax=Novosphingobium hassiacum TaxID=173676 RepID=A0A7W6EXW4_9SPHN|nr:hypothetical protein [Novosphingobium hassiacum]MBB3862520.1 hypothetical protein [Novosphingobium hassiacum]